MRVLVTGAAGFIGSHLAESLLAQGHHVIGLDSFYENYAPQVKRRNLRRALAHDGYRLIEGDLRDEAILQGAFQAEPEVVVHLAGLVGVRDSLLRPAEYMDVNVRGTTLVLEAARAAGVSRLVLASSSSVYGGGAPIPFGETKGEGIPLSPYAASKRAMEHVAGTYAHLYGQHIALLRFFTVYGPRQRPDLAIHKFARRILAGEPIPVFGDGTSRRDYTYVSDIIAGIEGSIRWTAQGAAEARVYNLASGRTITLSEMIAIIEQSLGQEAMINRLPDQPGDMPATWAEVDRAREELGLPLAVDFHEGLARFAQWLRGGEC